MPGSAEALGILLLLGIPGAISLYAKNLFRIEKRKSALQELIRLVILGGVNLSLWVIVYRSELQETIVIAKILETDISSLIIGYILAAQITHILSWGFVFFLLSPIFIGVMYVFLSQKQIIQNFLISKGLTRLQGADSELIDDIGMNWPNNREIYVSIPIDNNRMLEGRVLCMSEGDMRPAITFNKARVLDKDNNCIWDSDNNTDFNCIWINVDKCPRVIFYLGNKTD